MCIGYKEDKSKGALLRFEDSLPELPVPTLEETAKRYLKSVHAILSPSEYEETTKAVNEFIAPGGPGELLQKRLIAKAERPDVKNWMIDWWNEAAYLGYRDPVIPYVSYFYSHRDDRKRRDPSKRAAALTTAVLEFRKKVIDGSLEPEYLRKLPMAMSSYQYMFNCCRLPKKPSDVPIKYPYNENPFIVVIRKNQFFKVYHEVDGKQLTTSELEQQFKKVYERAEKSAPIGLFTTQNRDIWTDVRARLVDAHPTNKDSLEAIEASSFIVCLDDAAPVTLDERSRQYWHGDGQNRWFDKPLQFIVNNNGTSGFMGEHSMMDGTPTHRLNDYANMLIFTNALDFGNPSIRSHLPDPQALKFQLNSKLEEDIKDAQKHFDWQIGQHELRVQAYQGYGKGLIKKFKCSPDAYVQMIIQLAYFKMYGKNRPTYESASTRKFQLGRTETCRSVSDESVSFCKAITDPDITPDEARTKFRAALDAHVKYISDASDGKGVDRHLFGLKKSLKEGEDVPSIFADPAYAYSSHWFLSTSQLSSEYFNGYGWSQVVDDGFG